MPELRIDAKIGADGSGFQRTLGMLGKNAGVWAGSLKSHLASAFTAGAIIAFGKSIVGTVTKIKDLSEQAGISTDAVQEWGFAAEQTGLSFEDVAGALSKLGAARRDAAEGDEKLRKTFSDFGVSLSDLNNSGLQNVDILKRMAEAMRGIKFTSAQRQELRDLLGRSGDKLASVLDVLNEKRAPIISEEDIESIDRLEKSISNLFKTLKSDLAKPLANSVATPFLDAGRGFIKTIQEMAINSVALNIRSTDIGASLAEAASRNGTPIIEPELQPPDGSGTNSIPLFEDKAAKKDMEEASKIMVKLQEKLLDIQQKMMSVEKQREQIESQITSHLDEAFQLETEGFEKQGAEERAKAVDLLSQLQGLQSDNANRPIHSDSLAAIGGFVGGAVNADSSLFVQKSQLVTQQEILRYVREIQINSGRNADVNGAFVR